MDASRWRSGQTRWVLVVVAVAALVVPSPPAGHAQVRPTLEVVPGGGPVGQAVTASGAGWPPGRSVSIVFQSFSAVPVGTVVVGRGGTFSTSFVVPFALAGQRSVRAQVASLQVATPFTVFDTSLDLEPRAVQAGAALEISGQGFAAQVCGPAVLAIAGDEGEEESLGVAAVTAAGPGGSGAFTTEVASLDRSVGGHRVTARQEGGGCEVEETGFLDVFTFGVVPTLGRAGSRATVVGEGFPDAGECGLVVLTFDGESIGVVAPTGFPGDPFTHDFTVPARPPGTYEVIGVQDDACLPYRGRARFTIPDPDDPDPTTPDPTIPDPTIPPSGGLSPSLVVTPLAGPVDAEVQVAGAGFRSGVAVQVLVADGVVAEVAGVGVVGGGFATSFDVPVGVPGGATVVTACQGCSGAVPTTAGADFVVTPRLEVSPVIGPPGLATGVRGDGFLPGGPVALDWVRGLGGGRAAVGDDGVLVGSALVLHRDALGGRTLDHVLDVGAWLPTGLAPAEVAQFEAAIEAVVPDSTASAQFLVVPGSMQPGGFDVRR